MKKIEIIVPENDMVILKKEAKKNPREKTRNRAKAIILRVEGYTEREILNKMDISLNSMLTYIKDYQKHGLESIYTNNYKGPVSRLEVKADEIIEEFTKNPPKSLKGGCSRIKERFGISITETPLRYFLKKKFQIQNKK